MKSLLAFVVVLFMTTGFKAEACSPNQPAFEQASLISHTLGSPEFNEALRAQTRADVRVKIENVTVDAWEGYVAIRLTNGCLIHARPLHEMPEGYPCPILGKVEVKTLCATPAAQQ